MATNPVPQGNHPSNAEEQENFEKPTLAHLAKQTHTGQILHVPDFLNVVDDKILGNQIIQALRNSEFCKNAKPDKPDETFVLKKLKQHVGYGFVISEIMRKKGVPLRKPKNVASFKYLFRNPKTLRRRKPTEASTTSRDTVGSNAPKKKRGRAAKRTSRISEGLGSNEAPLVVMESANDEIDWTPNLRQIFWKKGVSLFFDEDPILAIELLRVKEWRKWRLEEYQSHISRAGPEIEKEELFALDWLGTEDIATAIQMSTIEEAYTNKVQAKLARSKEKLPVMEESFYALPVEDFEELDQANLQEGLQRSIMDFHHFPEEALIFQHDGNAMTQGEGPSNANEREIQILNEDFESDDDEASLKSTKRRKIIMSESSDSMNECQEDISTRIANAMEVRGDIQRHIYEDIYKQMQRLSDYQKNLNDAMQVYNEKKEKGWDEKFAALSKKVEAECCRGNNFTLAQCQSLLKVIHQHEGQISALHNELSTFRYEHTAKVDKIDSNVEKLLDYAKKGEESSHLALGTSIPVESSVGKGKRVFGFASFASKDPRPKFGVTQYFSDDKTTPYTMEDVPAIMRKQPEGDQRLWVAMKNQELKKGKSPAKSNINMLKEIEQYACHKGEYLRDGRSFEECVRWFVLGVLPGNNVIEAYSYYITGQVYDEYFVDEYVEDFRKLREHINKMLEKRSMEKSKA
nr:uncharacterized protein LOC109192376 [Ipomoea trifida]